MPAVALDPERVRTFWAALEAAEVSFINEAHTSAGTNETYTDLCGLLHNIHPDLLLVVGSPAQRRPEVVISAGGMTNAFGAVTEVVGAAPETVRARYDIRAFRPRVGDPSGIEIRTEGVSLTPRDVRWDAVRDRTNRSVCHLDLHVLGFIDALPADGPANRARCSAVFLLLDHLVGEWAVEAQIGRINFHSHQDAADLPTLLTLPAYLDRIAAE